MKHRFPPQKPDNSAAWVDIANNVLNNVYHNADGSTVESLKIGLRNLSQPICKLAFQKLCEQTEAAKPKSKKK